MCGAWRACDLPSPYSPDLNPIEFAFAKVKRWLVRHGTCAADPVAVYNLVLSAVEGSHARAYIRHCSYDPQDYLEARGKLSGSDEDEMWI